MPNHQLSTARDVISAIGGTKAAMALTGRGATTVSNWRIVDRLPAETFLKFQVELARVGKKAPASLWGIAEPGQAA